MLEVTITALARKADAIAPFGPVSITATLTKLPSNDTAMIRLAKAGYEVLRLISITEKPLS